MSSVSFFPVASLSSIVYMAKYFLLHLHKDLPLSTIIPKITKYQTKSSHLWIDSPLNIVKTITTETVGTFPANRSQ